MPLNQIANPSLALLLRRLSMRVVISVRVSSMCQINLFKNHSYSIEPCAKKSLKKQHKNVNMNIECMIPYPLGSNPSQIDRPLRSILLQEILQIINKMNKLGYYSTLQCIFLTI